MYQAPPDFYGEEERHTPTTHTLSSTGYAQGRSFSLVGHFALLFPRSYQTMAEAMALLSRVLMPTTLDALKWAGLQRGSRCLDIGCGNGLATLGLARMLGRVGRVVGADNDEEALAAARKHVAQQFDEESCARISFVKCVVPDDMAALDKHKFDLVYSRLLFSYLPDPATAMSRVKDLLWPGGRVLVEDVDYSGAFCYPPNKAFETYKDLHMGEYGRCSFSVSHDLRDPGRPMRSQAVAGR